MRSWDSFSQVDVAGRVVSGDQLRLRQAVAARGEALPVDGAGCGAADAPDLYNGPEVIRAIVLEGSPYLPGGRETHSLGAGAAGLSAVGVEGEGGAALADRAPVGLGRVVDGCVFLAGL